MESKQVCITKFEVECYLSDLWDRQRCICEDLHGTKWPFQLIENAGFGYLVEEFKKKFNDNCEKQYNRKDEKRKDRKKKNDEVLLL